MVQDDRGDVGASTQETQEAQPHRERIGRQGIAPRIVRRIGELDRPADRQRRRRQKSEGDLTDTERAPRGLPDLGHDHRPVPVDVDQERQSRRRQHDEPDQGAGRQDPSSHHAGHRPSPFRSPDPARRRINIGCDDSSIHDSAREDRLSRRDDSRDAADSSDSRVLRPCTPGAPE